MRLFIAYPLTNEEKLHFSNVAFKYREFVDGNWVDKKNYHITIKFLGEVNGKVLTKVVESMDNIQGTLEPFDLNIDRHGFFGKPKPKVLWFGASFMPDSILHNFYTIQDECQKLGFEKEKHYIPHITICRIKTAKNNLKMLDNFNFVPLKININKVILYKSILTDKGSVYTKIKEWNI